MARVPTRATGSSPRATTTPQSRRSRARRARGRRCGRLRRGRAEGEQQRAREDRQASGRARRPPPPPRAARRGASPRTPVDHTTAAIPQLWIACASSELAVPTFDHHHVIAHQHRRRRGARGRARARRCRTCQRDVPETMPRSVRVIARRHAVEEHAFGCATKTMPISASTTPTAARHESRSAAAEADAREDDCREAQRAERQREGVGKIHQHEGDVEHRDADEAASGARDAHRDEPAAADAMIMPLRTQST